MTCGNLFVWIGFYIPSSAVGATLLLLLKSNNGDAVSTHQSTIRWSVGSGRNKIPLLAPDNRQNNANYLRGGGYSPRFQKRHGEPGRILRPLRLTQHAETERNRVHLYSGQNSSSMNSKCMKGEMQQKWLTREIFRAAPILSKASHSERATGSNSMCKAEGMATVPPQSFVTQTRSLVVILVFHFE